MKYYKTNAFLLLISIILISSCREPQVSFSRIDYIIPEHIDFKAADLKTGFEDLKIDASSSVYIVVVIYSYSSGAETISFSGGDDVTTVTAGGRLKALVKVMDGEKILRAEFAEGSGTSREDILLSLQKEIKLKLAE